MRLLGRMHELAMILRGAAIPPRLAGADDERSQSRSGLPTAGCRGAHVVENTESHQIIEEFMLAANEAVAEILACRGPAVSSPRPFRSRSAQAQGAR